MEIILAFFLFVCVVAALQYVAKLIEKKAEDKAQILYSKKKDELLRDVFAEK